MEHQALRAALENIVPLQEDEWNLIKSRFQLKQIPAKTFLTTLGEIESEAYFIVRGIVRLFCHNPKKEEITIFLFKENFFASSYHSFITQTPSSQALETLEDTTLLSIKKKALDELYHLVPKMNLVTRIIAEQRFINSQTIFTSQIMHTAGERYLQFEKNHGDLLLRVPHHIIASFLGITPGSMSRIRKRLAKKRTVS